MTKKEVINSINNNHLSSIYTKDDVLKLINAIDVDSLLIELKNVIDSAVQHMDEDCMVDKREAEFSIEHNELVLDSVEIYRDGISQTICMAVEDYLKN